MSRTRTLAVILVAILLLVSWPAAGNEGTDVPTVEDDGASSRLKEFPNSDTWEWLNPIPNHNKLNDVMWQPTGDRMTIVGHSGLISEKEGSVWRTIQSNTIYNLWHIEYRSTGDYALIVGNHGTVMKYVPGQATLLNSGTSTRLQGVDWKADNSYALICGWEGLLIKYDTVKFTKIDTGFNGKLFNVSQSANGEWLIVGEGGTILRYDEPTGNVTRIETGIDDILYNLDWNGDTALIVGQNGTILKYNAGTVSKVSNPVTSNHLWGVEWDHVNGYALIVGIDGTGLMYETPGGISDISPGTVEWLISISFLSGGNDAYIVGTSGTVYHRAHGANWVKLSSSPIVGDFKDVAWAMNGTQALIVGSGGAVVRYDGTSLNRFNQSKVGTTETLRAISWNPDGIHALIVGDSGTVLEYNGTSTNFTKLNAGITNQDFLAVDWRDDGAYALIVGSFGKILKYDGVTFMPIVPEDQAQFFLFGVAFHPLNTYALIVGASGMGYKCEEDPAPKYQPAGVKCLRVATGVFTTLRDVEFRSDGTYAIAVGLSGIVLKYDGASFDEVESDSPPFSLADVKWKTDSNYPVIVGSDGIFLKYSGYGAVQMPCPTIAALNGISWSGTNALVVGDKNQILLYESPPLNNPFASILRPGEGDVYTIEDQIEFSAFSSLAPDQETVQFFWLSNISGTLSTEPMFKSKMALGHHRITLYVNSSGGGSDMDQVDIIVKLNAQPPAPVISSPIDGATYNSTDDIYFDSSGSTDPNHDTLQFYWYSDIQGNLAAGTGFSLNLILGRHMITLWAFDGVFNVSTSINITVKEPNKEPVVTIVSPKATDEVHEGEDIRFEATAQDPDSDPMAYSWFSNVSGFLDSHKSFLGTLPEGKHTITFHADDGIGHNVSAMVNITVLPPIHVNEPPTIEVEYPDEGETIRGVVNVTGTTKDTDGIVKAVEYKIGNDNWRIASGNESWSFQWDTLAFENGEYTFLVRAYDGENHTVLTRNVTISNKWKDVHAYFLYPADGLTLNGNVEVKGRSYHDQATKGRSIQLVEVRVDDGSWKVASGTDPWVWKLDTTDLKNGEHTLELKAMDDEGTYSEVESVTITVKNEAEGLGISTEMLLLVVVVVIIVILLVALALRPRKGRTKDDDDDDMDFEREMEEERRAKGRRSRKKKDEVPDEEE